MDIWRTGVRAGWTVRGDRQLFHGRARTGLRSLLRVRPRRGQPARRKPHRSWGQRHPHAKSSRSSPTLWWS